MAEITNKEYILFYFKGFTFRWKKQIIIINEANAMIKAHTK